MPKELVAPQPVRIVHGRPAGLNEIRVLDPDDDYCDGEECEDAAVGRENMKEYPVRRAGKVVSLVRLCERCAEREGIE
jgi:hypothetical protein